jgi:APA family basic amino acid/polyamine antiporter
MGSNRAEPPRGVSALVASFIVIANMVGTGVFTSLGFQVSALPSPLAIMALWVVGGLGALAGALCYGEIGAMMPRSGGEYHYLSRIYHPAVGFLAGWVSLTVGFAAPVALAAMALSAYTSRLVALAHPTLTAAAVVVLISVVHSAGLKAGGRFQSLFTTAKILLILGFSAIGLVAGHPQALQWVPTATSLGLMTSGSFAVSLVFVSYAYSGWNASAYIAGEMARPERDLPRSLLLGTAVVMGLYLLLNVVFLRAAPMSELSGQIDVGNIAARHLLGPTGASLMGGLIALGLVSTISAMTWAGPRVAQVIGEDVPILRPLAVRNGGGAPYLAILFQLILVLAMLATSSFEKILTYLGFTLALCTVLTVFGVFVLRVRSPQAPRPYRTWGYPVTPLVFLAINGWMLVYLLLHQPFQSLAGLGTILAGVPLYFLAGKKKG